MIPPLRRWIIFTIIAISFLVIVFHTLAEPIAPYAHHHGHHSGPPEPVQRIIHPGFFKPKFRWRNLKQKFPVDSFNHLPRGATVTIPKIQHEFRVETPQREIERKRRLAAVEKAFDHSWEGYKKYGWMQDEIQPISGRPRNPFGGWAATLVDSLDSLWIMGRKKDFKAALHAVKSIDFASTVQDELNVFETTIRYLGGLLSAYDVSGQRYGILLKKAIELGDMLYMAFDTPNRMPVTRWDWQNTVLGKEQEARKQSLVAEVGSLTLEFTRLSQLTGDPKWYDAVARVTNVFEDCQNHTKIPGLWPVMLDVKNTEFTKDTTFTLGGMADSLYEYLPKQHLLLGGQSDQYRNMYLTALPAAKEHLFFRPLNPANHSMLVSGTVKRYSAAHVKLQPYGEHLSCFAGGMVALAAKIFKQTHDLETARELVDGCIWASESTASGIMPEIFAALPCSEAKTENCTWDEEIWRKAVVEKANGGFVPEDYTERAQGLIRDRKLAPGLVEIKDPRYILRPEHIESLFVLYRITGDKKLQDTAWELFQSIEKATKTSIAYAALKDVRQTEEDRQLLDNMESFWTAETLKYFFLIFSEPTVVSLDQYVFNTEAHPLLRPT